MSKFFAFAFVPCARFRELRILVSHGIRNSRDLIVWSAPRRLRSSTERLVFENMRRSRRSGEENMMIESKAKSKAHERGLQERKRYILDRRLLKIPHVRSTAFARNVERICAGDFRNGPNGKSTADMPQVEVGPREGQINLSSIMSCAPNSRSTKWRASSRRRKFLAVARSLLVRSPVYVEIRQEKGRWEKIVLSFPTLELLSLERIAVSRKFYKEIRMISLLQLIMVH